MSRLSVFCALSPVSPLALAAAPPGLVGTWKYRGRQVEISAGFSADGAFRQAPGERAKAALETQRAIAEVAARIVENRLRTHAGIRHANWLLLTGQEGYTNPFDGRTETDTSPYRGRWADNRGDVLYADPNSFDPNRTEEYNTREWKRTPVRPR